ncbi:MAG TPA: N-acetylmuramoyl-L-alanine amidase [Nocardioides sp.]|nr:N-acetylmuramoyl-L-alanine amidase [Nocardioides sp.]
MTTLVRVLAAVVALGVGLAVAALGAAGVVEARGVDVPLLGDGWDAAEGAGADAAAPAPSPSPTSPSSSSTASPDEPSAAPTQPGEELRPSHRRGSARDRQQGQPAQPGEGPLAGRVVVLDPGHQLGNAAHPSEINQPVDAGGFTKACNTTGTSTDGGYPEATFAWEVAVRARRMLEGLGATVELTRESNSADLWGPCVDERGRAGNPGEPGPTADVKVSIHGDGTYQSGAHGFHVIAPGDLPGYTDDIEADSLDLAHVVRDALVQGGFAVSTYTGSDGIDVRTDLGTLNLADEPTVMVELGNMRDPGDAAVMASADGQQAYAAALVAGVSSYLR